MVDATSLNRIGQTSFISGLSGSNFTNIIKAEYQKDISTAAPIQRQMVAQQQKLARYKQLAQLIGNLKSVAEKLGTSGLSMRAVSLQAAGATPPEQLVKMSVSDAAAIGKVSVKVLQLASTHKVASDDQSSATTALNKAGVLTLKAGDRAAMDIAVTDTMSLNDVAKAINDKSAETGVQASVVKISDTAYKLVLSAQDSNQAIHLGNASGDAAQGLGLLGAGGKFTKELSTPKPARIELNGLEIARDSNKITDALPGVTLNLLRADPANGVTATVETDRDGIKAEIKKFAEAFNKFRQFVISQQATIPGAGAAPGAHLFGDSILKNVSEGVFRELTGTTDVNGVPVGLRAIGLSLDNNNTLTIDDSKLEKALASDLDCVKAFFLGRGTEKGLSERLKTALSQWSGDSDSVIEKELKTLEGRIAERRDDIRDITTRADQRRKELVTRYARLEQQIAASKLMIRQLEAIAKARSSNS